MYVYVMKYVCICSDGIVIFNLKMCVCICVISKKYRLKFLLLQILLKKRIIFFIFYVFVYISFLRVVDFVIYLI